jgi:hypothetical protein
MLYQDKFGNVLSKKDVESLSLWEIDNMKVRRIDNPENIS